MQRDMDLIRKIMLAIEANPTPELAGEPLVKDYSDAQVNEHIRLLREAGYITALAFEGNARIVFGQLRLLWPGYEFLDNARDDTRWKKIRKLIRDKAGSVSFAVISSTLTWAAEEAAKGAIKFP
jgi:DNA-binding transcriptional ArsR family regulator